MVKFRIRIENIVASTTLEVEIPLAKIVSKVEDVEYEPEQFPGAVYRMKRPRAAALIFGSGKIVCTGARKLADVKYVFKKILQILRSVHIAVPRAYEIQVENIVASAKFGGRLDLDKVALQLETAEYEPEQFPGLVYRIKEPKIAFLLFSSGKIICTGARNLKDVRSSITALIEKLEKMGAIIKE